MLEQMLRNFFYPIVQSEAFQVRAREWLSSSNPFRWDTSPLKLVDNLTMQLFRCHKCGKSNSFSSSITYHSDTNEYLCSKCAP